MLLCPFRQPAGGVGVSYTVYCFGGLVRHRDYMNSFFVGIHAEFGDHPGAGAAVLCVPGAEPERVSGGHLAARLAHRLQRISWDNGDVTAVGNWPKGIGGALDAVGVHRLPKQEELPKDAQLVSTAAEREFSEWDRPEVVVPPGRVRIFTDTSLHPEHRSRGVGLGVVAVLPGGQPLLFSQRWRRKKCSPLIGELLAVQFALQLFPHEPQLGIRTDSTGALQEIMRSVPTSGGGGVKRAARNIAAEVNRLQDGRDVSFRWIRGHNGTVGNETADTLAKLAYRGETPSSAVEDSLTASVQEQEDAAEKLLLAAQ